MVKIDRVSGKRVFAGEPTDDPKSSLIWEAFKADTEPPRATRQDELASQRDALIAAIRRAAAAHQQRSAPVAAAAAAVEDVVVEEPPPAEAPPPQ
jgi:penicillin-binding protein 1A